MTDAFDDEMTLDPPGSIAVVGAGALGLEAALYGRFLGYNVIVFESGEICENLGPLGDAPPPVLPDQCLSPLALSALAAQREADPDATLTLPTTTDQWVDEHLRRLAETDLLRDRVLTHQPVRSLTTVSVEAEEEGEDTSDLPCDFELEIASDPEVIERQRFEAVVLAIGKGDDIRLEVELPIPYLFRIGGSQLDDASDLIQGRQQIVGVFASLAGRSDLDLYRPKRV